MSFLNVWAVGACLVLLVGCGGETDLLTSPVGPANDGGTGPETGCAGLAACCNTLPAGAQSGCAMFIATGNETQCEEALTEVQQVGYCGGTGSGSGSSPPGNPDCGTLAACCATFNNSAEATQCEGIVAQGNAAECASAAADFEGAGLCGPRVGSGPGTGHGTRCVMLASCCSTLPAGDVTGCEEIVSEGNQAVCSADLMAFGNAGLCAGSIGSPPETTCDELATCCSSPALTTEQAVACEETASSGDQPACDEGSGIYCVK